MCISGTGLYALVSCRFLPTWFCHDSVGLRNGRVELFSASLVNCVWGCKLLMCSSSSCR